MTLLSPYPGLSGFNARMLRLNHSRITGAMEVLAPGHGESERLYTTRTTLPMMGRALALQYSKTEKGVDCGQTARLTVALGTDMARLAIDDIRRKSDNELVICDSLRVVGRSALQPTVARNIDGFGVDVHPDGQHGLYGLLGSQHLELPDADIHAADDLAVACITILEGLSST
jgi:hypothetical protein